MAAAPMVRFFRHVERTTDCWLWTGARNPRGYGTFWSGETYMGAHRAAWLLLRGPIPAGMEIDHLCRVKACVRPEHLEPVPPEVNRERAAPHRVHGKSIVGPTCPEGHLFVPENTYRHPYGYLYCKTCRRGRQGRVVDATPQLLVT